MVTKNFFLLLSITYVITVNADLWTDSFHFNSNTRINTPKKAQQVHDREGVGEQFALELNGDSLNCDLQENKEKGFNKWSDWERSEYDDSNEHGHDIIVSISNYTTIPSPPPAPSPVIPINERPYDSKDFKDIRDVEKDWAEDEVDKEDADEDDTEEADFLPTDDRSIEYVQALKEIGMKKLTDKAKGITYSFYNNYGGCKTPLEIQSDIESLSFDIIRVYDTDCDGVGNILKVLEPEQKIFAGIYYLDKIFESVDVLSVAINAYANGDWSKIDTVSVGNELINFGQVTPEDIEYAVDLTRDLLYAKGFEGSVVSTDTLVAVLHHPELCSISDYISVNSHPYWDGNVDPQDAGPWLQNQLEILANVCGVKVQDILLAETGWPKRGAVFGYKGVPSKDNQYIAIKSIVDTLGSQTILFTSANELWKNDGSHGVEKFWGLFDE